MTSPSAVPAIFHRHRDYAVDAEALDAGHSTSNEQALYEAISGRACLLARGLGRPLRVADLCCATGGAARHVAQHAPVSRAYLVDIEPAMVMTALPRFAEANICHYGSIADAVTWTAPEKVDAVLMNSAYHHIEDDRKVAYLANARGMLADGGLILLGEHFLPEYEPGGTDSYRQAVLAFYTERIAYLERIGTPSEQVDVIRQTGLYCWQRMYEYQVSFAVFEQTIQEAGLTISFANRVWPHDEEVLPSRCGSFCIVLGD